MHFVQVALNKQMGLVEFDYGSKDLNMKAYRQETPPTVNFNKLRAELPIALVYADNDAFTE